ncbi:hypothetical protein TRFO_06886 [Tritrichomonas foetus]|uniref:Thioredoxin domain-containing protein n=1 Tax=Tritrichomonas foetus TaxID=1144522 RepID=A0A1J4JZD5_9EUKA|nr:hypothetical protein TRFO_06886 [Tritrichomonas foetus]|eukprot:OHT02854.1 hypothetical protein TRFO_06886 [Tritrichomonas foetus]
MLIFLSLLQTFIPYSEPSVFEHPELNSKELDELVQTNKTIIAFMANKYFDNMKPVIRSMNEVASLFKDYATFVFLRPDTISESGGHPLFVFCKNGEIVSIHNYPQYDGVLIKMIQSLIHPITINTKSELFDYLGDCPWTILTTPKLYDKAIDIFRYNLTQHQRRFAEFDIVLVSPEFLNEIDLDVDRLALFRNSDNMIVSFDNFDNAIIPYYTVLSQRTMYTSDNYIFGISGVTFTREMKDLLYELSDSYPDITFGFILEDFYGYIKGNIGFNLSEISHFSTNKNSATLLIFNINQRFHVDISDIFTEQIFSKSFDYKEWLKLSKKALTLLKAGKLKRKYLSEPIPENQERLPIQNVVASNFDEFLLNNTNKDVIMAFTSIKSPYLHDLNQALYDFYFWAKVNTTETYFNSFVIGMIDVINNGGNFPFIPDLPQIYIYPAKAPNNDTIPEPKPVYGGLNVKNLRWFMNRFGTHEIPVEVENYTDSEFENDFLRSMGRVMRMPQEEKDKFFDWAFEIANKTGVDITKLPSVPKTHPIYHPVETILNRSEDEEENLRFNDYYEL